jgi:hypothetical protein
MPWGDGTGPAGMGPVTGRGAGYCVGAPVPGWMNPWGGRFGGRGRWGGRGRGHRHWYYATGLPGWARAGWAPGGGRFVAPWPVDPASAGPPPTGFEPDPKALRAQAEYLEEALAEVRRQIAELEGEEREGEERQGE